MEASIYPCWIFKSNPFHGPLFVINLFKEPDTLQKADKKPLLSEVYHKGKKSTSKLCQCSELSKNFTF